MNDPEVAAARAYEALFVPALFAEWAPRVADAASLAAGQRVLDVACGTGVLVREAVRRTSGNVTGLDRNAGMLAVASEVAPEVDWRRGSAESMPFADASFDAVVSQFGLMFMDRERAIREMLRVLRPGGRLAVAVWDSVEHMPAFAAETALLEELVGTRAADALRAPFVLGDPKQLVALFEAAGAGSVTAATRKGSARFPSIRSLVEADLRGWLPVMGVHLRENEIDRVLGAAERQLAEYAAPDGKFTFETSAHIVSARR
jgi:SAM-dependent methyltransferase